MTVLILDDDPDLRDSLGDVISELCRQRCLFAESFDDLVALDRRVDECRLALLDVNLGPDRPSGVDAYEWLRARGFQGRIVFLTGHARTHPAVAHAAAVDGAAVHQKPISVDALRSLVEGR